MLWVIFLLFAVCSAISPPASKTCETYGGKTLYTFSETKEIVKIPCKYNAIRNTRCGPYSITLTPGNDYDYASKRYLPSTLWVRVEHIATGLRFEGRTDNSITNKWIKGYGKNVYPLVKKDGYLNFTDVFQYPLLDPNYVFIKSKNYEFSIGYYLFDPTISQSYGDSGFAFTCYKTSEFEPASYPDQVCGNGTADEVRTFKNQMGYDSRDATLITNVFKIQGLDQWDTDCRSAGKMISTRCEGREYEAVSSCETIFTHPRTVKCVSKKSTIRSAFRHCVEYMCSGKTDKNACKALTKELKACKKLKGKLNYVLPESCY